MRAKLLALLLILNGVFASADIITSYQGCELTDACYQDLSSTNKLNALWRALIETQYVVLPSFVDQKTSFKKKWQGLKAILSLDKSFSYVSDSMPNERPKVIHGFGSTALFDFVAAPYSPYTGVLKGGQGILRLSLATEPKDSFTPGLAVKFLIDHRPSVNIHVMNRLEGQGNNKNIFENEFTNILPEPTTWKTKLGKVYFELFTEDAIHLSVSHLTTHSSAGVTEEQPIAPYQIILVPTEEVKYDPHTKLDFRNELAKIPVGTKLYSVWAKRSRNNQQEFIGEIYSRSPFITSDFGDRFLHFQHHQ